MTANLVPRQPALDGVRALAVLAVLVGHFGPIPLFARVGVNGFFVLSGYLITGLLLAEYRRTRNISLRRFYFRRACRIFPAYYVFLGLSWALLTQTATPMSRGGILSTATYTSNYYIMNHVISAHRELAGLIHTWSLSVEEQFYLLWPAALLLLLRRGMNWVRWGLAVAIVARLWMFGWQHVGYNFEANAHWLAIGCLIATIPSALLARWTWAPQWMSYPVLAWIGTISYSLYLWHVLGGAVAAQLTETAGVGRFSLAVALSIALAAISYYFVERPILRWRDRRPLPAPAPDQALRALLMGGTDGAQARLLR